MAQTTSEQDSRTPIEKDAVVLAKLKGLIAHPEGIQKLSDSEIAQLMDECEMRLGRVSMGGRSSSLKLLCVLLWSLTDRESLALTLRNRAEALAVAGLRTVGDPSIIEPEWGIVLAGVILARWPNGLDAIARKTLIDIVEYHASESTNAAVVSAARGLLDEISNGFKNGLSVIIDRALSDWPSTEAAESMNEVEYEQEKVILNSIVSAKLTPAQRSLYRLELQKTGMWDIISTTGRLLK